MPSIVVVARLAVLCTLTLLVLMGVLTHAGPKGKLDWDWPFIAAYILLFLCFAAMYWMRRQPVLALATAAFVLATAVFDTLENLAAYRRTGWEVHVSIPKWACFFVCVALTVPLFLAVRTGLARTVAVLLALSGLGGLVASFTIDPAAGRAPEPVFLAAGVAILAFLLASVILWRNPRVLLS